jgi:excisionase family DNA binding protein
MLLSYADFASRLGAKHGTVKRWVHEGMPVVRMGRWVQIDVEAATGWLREHPRHGSTIGRDRCVYFAEDTRGRIKIGFSLHPNQRRHELAKGGVGRVRILAAIPGDKRVELMMHMRFAEQHEAAEWFRCEGDLAAFVATLKQTRFAWRAA